MDFLLILIVLGFFVLIFFQKKLIDLLNLRLDYLNKKHNKLQNLVDLLASTSNLAAKSLYFKLNNIPLEEYPENREQMAEVVEKFSHENFKNQYDTLTQIIKQTNDPIEKARLQKKLEKLDELKILASLLSNDSSDEYKQTIFENINIILRELNEVQDED